VVILVADQSRIFEDSEGDRWFARNAAHLSDSHPDDHVLALLERAEERAQVRSMCEVGCANGWRLAAARRRLPAISRLAGFDVSQDAVEDGRSRWPEIELAVGPADVPPIEGPFDAVIVSFVLHWVDRARLAATIAAIDALVAPGGVLLLADFLPDSPCARRYHHRSDCEVYTYKQDYSHCFGALGFYQEEEAVVFAHGAAAGAPVAHEQDRAFAKAMRKTLAGYRHL
jgi:SAM-dependent methyltransferase